MTFGAKAKKKKQVYRLILKRKILYKDNMLLNVVVCNLKNFETCLNNTAISFYFIRVGPMQKSDNVFGNLILKCKRLY